ncbi:phenylalanine--tRNA ligase subunit beta [Helicobacter saguini]|uniref:Phenylalanine--tRNA ligase beta subunit n=2 Tax=Helicobacter saguini TaxID=1548018 RepID=A0A347W6Y7_9HELI|nr:phenylalanine--tRNA ligase subunit beta [Helicobacter saguini]MWV66593.1 phenylalanine--tRNA ligase subunit beta [Helicobacter saguini]MWV68944.1 phenylalanine--tRNA ligase subunit beta [Helicobacter saguini]MWV71502.1 phenylalanine--tRNA ligase subunit beta [Helicobacter saguini]TLD92214.1 phenylalanine--tRNA ligase subunit beta [Helicobacter saguini]
MATNSQDSKKNTESKNHKNVDSKENIESNHKDSNHTNVDVSHSLNMTNNSLNMTTNSQDSKKSTESKNHKNVDSKENIESNHTTITKSQIRGIDSYGMLCSSTELGLPKLNDGILVLDSSIGELTLGKELSEYPVFNQNCLELGITPNRGDCLSVLGVARDIASMFNLIVKNISNIEPSVALGVGRFLSIIPRGDLHASLLYRLVEIKEGFTPLYIALTLGITQNYKDDVVANFLNYTTFMTGVLFNAYPINSKIVSPNAKEAKLIIQNDEHGLESIYADSVNESGQGGLNKLNEIGVNSYDLKKYDYPLTLILEASFINAEYIANKLCGLNVPKNADVVHKSTRGSNPDLELGMNFLCKNLNALKIMLYSGVQEIIRDIEIHNIHMTFAYISECIGNHIPKEEIALILKRLNFRIQATCDENFFIANPPTYRNDIKNRQDVAEEILRFYGIDKVTPINHKVEQIPQLNAVLSRHQRLKDLRYKAVGNGFVECVHYVFDNSSVLKELGYEVLQDSKKLVNPITSELDTLRPSLLPHILESMQRNKRYGFESMRLFEIGYIYDSERNAKLSLAFVMNDFLKPPSFPNPKGIRLDFYNFASVVAEIIGNFECVNIAPSFIKSRLIHPYQNGKMLNGENILGVISKLHPEIAKKYDLDSVFFCEIDVDLLLQSSGVNALNEVSKFQANRRDLTLLIDKNISFNSVKSEIENLHLKILKSFFPLDVFNENDSQNALSIRFIMQSFESTLTESSMQDALQKILDVLESKFHARLKV